MRGCAVRFPWVPTDPTVNLAFVSLALSVPFALLYTFYYLELAIDSRLQRKVDQLRQVLNGSRGNITYDWRGVEYIRNKEEFLDWKYHMSGRTSDGGGGRRFHGPREVLDTFRSSSMVEEEMAVKVVTREVENRTWYSPEAWEHGGLRLKEEVKQEDEGPSAKRARKE